RSIAPGPAVGLFGRVSLWGEAGQKESRMRLVVLGIFTVAAALTINVQPGVAQHNARFCAIAVGSGSSGSGIDDCSYRTLEQCRASALGLAKTCTERPNYRSSNRAAPARTAQIPLPNPVLLQRQAVPDCTFRGQVSTPPTTEEVRQRLDYEQQCYRQAETIVRERLDQLQHSVHEMIKAVRQP